MPKANQINLPDLMNVTSQEPTGTGTVFFTDLSEKRVFKVSATTTGGREYAQDRSVLRVELVIEVIFNDEICFSFKKWIFPNGLSETLTTQDAANLALRGK